MLCSDASLVNRGQNTLRAVTMRCRSWGCDLCNPIRKRQLVALAKRGKPTTFITLTVNPATGESPAARARSLALAWRIIVRRAKKKYGYSSIPYMCVFEATKQGEPHLHILCRVKWIDQRWLSNQMKKLTGAPVVHICRVKDVKKLANYVAKYIGKDPQRFETCKRYWCTRSYKYEDGEKEPEPAGWEPEWVIWKYRLYEIEAMWRARGFDVQMEGGTLVAAWEAPVGAPEREFWSG